MFVLNQLPQLRMADWYVAGGAIVQTIWNHLHGFEPNFGIKDFDVVYFDPDLSYEAEDVFIQRGKQFFADSHCEVEIRNQARVHLWYQTKFKIEIPPYTCVEHAMSSWLSTAACVGVRLDENNELEVFCPYGLSDVFGMIIRPNRIIYNRQAHYDSKAEQWCQKWPLLKAIPWQEQ